LQASGLPSGAQQVPVREPLLVVKLQSWPLLRDLQACIASAGGLPGPEPPWPCCAGWAESAPQDKVTTDTKHAFAVRLFKKFIIKSLNSTTHAGRSLYFEKKLWGK
jgi:hypothetical protein